MSAEQILQSIDQTLPFGLQCLLQHFRIGQGKIGRRECVHILARIELQLGLFVLWQTGVFGHVDQHAGR